MVTHPAVTGLCGFSIAALVLTGCGEPPPARGGQAAASHVLRVPEQHPTLAQALAAAATGDTILLAPGVHVAGVSLDGDGVVLASLTLTTGDTSHVRETILDGAGGDHVLRLPPGSDNAVIHGLTLRNADDCIYPKAHFELHRSVITGCADGIDFEEGSGGVLRNSFFENNRDDGIDLDQDVAVVIENNVIRGNEQDGIEIRLQPYTGPVRRVVIRGNRIHSNGEDGIQFIDYDGLSNRHYHVVNNDIHDNGMAGIGCMDNEETTEDYRAALIPEPIVLEENRITGNPIALSCRHLSY